jgi:hypothetical protein
MRFQVCSFSCLAHQMFEFGKGLSDGVRVWLRSSRFSPHLAKSNELIDWWY